MDDLKKALDGLMLGLLKFPFRVGQGVYRAFVLATLWSWFVVPQFGYRPLPLVAAYGLLLIASLFYRFSHAEDEARKHATGVFLMDILGSLLASSMVLAVGWVTHHFFF